MTTILLFIVYILIISLWTYDSFKRRARAELPWPRLMAGDLIWVPGPMKWSKRHGPRERGWVLAVVTYAGIHGFEWRRLLRRKRTGAMGYKCKWRRFSGAQP